MIVAFWLVCAVVVLFGFVVFRGAPYVPSKVRDLNRAFDDLYPLTSDDTLVDIGSGDGIVLRVASRHGARAVGYEINPLLVFVSRLLSRHDARVEAHIADFWRVHLPDETTIVYTFGDTRDIGKMAVMVQHEAIRLKKTLYFMSYGFSVPGETPLKVSGAYFLYKFSALQGKKA